MSVQNRIIFLCSFSQAKDELIQHYHYILYGISGNDINIPIYEATKKKKKKLSWEFMKVNLNLFNN